MARQGKVLKTQSRLEVIKGLVGTPEGKITSDNGKATSILGDLIGRETETTAFSSLITAMEKDGLVYRIKVKGGKKGQKSGSKRTYEIGIDLDNIPSDWASLLVCSVDYSKAKPVQVVEEVKPEIKIVEKEVDYDKLSISLLNAVAEVLTHDSWNQNQTMLKLEERLEEAKKRVNMLLEDNDRLRKKAEAQSDMIVAAKQEIGGLRAKISQLELNLKKQGRDTDILVNERVRKEIDRFMREIPKENINVE